MMEDFVDFFPNGVKTGKFLFSILKRSDSGKRWLVTFPKRGLRCKKKSPAAKAAGGNFSPLAPIFWGEKGVKEWGDYRPIHFNF